MKEWTRIELDQIEQVILDAEKEEISHTDAVNALLHLYHEGPFPEAPPPPPYTENDWLRDGYAFLEQLQRLDQTVDNMYMNRAHGGRDVMAAGVWQLGPLIKKFASKLESFPATFSWTAEFKAFVGKLRALDDRNGSNRDFVSLWSSLERTALIEHMQPDEARIAQALREEA